MKYKNNNSIWYND